MDPLLAPVDAGARLALQPVAPRSTRAATERTLATLLSAGLAASAGMTHISATVDHTSEWWPYSAFFAALATTQFAWAWAIIARPSLRLFWLGLCLHVTVVCLWAVSRTTGIPIGPNAWQHESVGLSDTVASVDEAFIVILLAPALLLAGLSRTAGALTAIARRCAPILIAVSLTAFLVGAHAG
jgi:hypothetical protein